MTAAPDLAAWLREAVTQRLELARKATPGPWAWEATGEKDSSWAAGLVQDEDGNTLSGELQHGQGVIIDGVCESIGGHLPDAAHVAANDPQDTIARCEAELAILDEHASDGDRIDPECTGCAARHPEYCECDTAAPWPCRTVRLLGSGYRHRAGYLADLWAP